MMQEEEEKMSVTQTMTEQTTWTFVESRALCTVCGRIVSAGYAHPTGTRFAPHGVYVCPACVDDLVRMRVGASLGKRR